MLDFDEERLLSLLKPYDYLNKKSGGITDFSITDANKPLCIKEAEKALEEPIPMLLLSDYLKYNTIGSRTAYERPMYKRRNMLLSLVSGEIADGKKGRYIEKICDIVWNILDESTWVVPAHNMISDNYHAPHEFEGYDTLDLFSAATGAAIATTYYLLKDEFEKTMPVYLNKRIQLLLKERIVEPYISDFYPSHSWKGLEGWYVNNWNPWITSNTLITTLVAIEDDELRKTVIKRAVKYLKNYFNFTFEDGACIEGAGYYFAATISVFDIAQMLYDFTDGDYSLFDNQYLKKMVEYLPNMYAGNNNFFSMSDYSRSPNHEYAALPLLLRAGKLMHSESVLSLAKDIYNNSKNNGELFSSDEFFHPYQFFKKLNTVMDFSNIKTVPLKSIYLESVQIMTARSDDMTVFCKGGNNNEPHGHNDVGEFTLYYKKNPLFIDAGVGQYTASSFTSARDAKWFYHSSYHNTPTLNGCEQVAGYQGSPDIKYRAVDVHCDINSLTLSSELKNAYPDDSKIKTALRTVALKGSKLTVTDEYEFESKGKYAFNIVSTKKPRLVNNTLVYECSGDKIVCEFNEGYKADIETIDNVDSRIQNIWLTDVLYRVSISTVVKSDKFTFTARVK